MPNAKSPKRIAADVVHPALFTPGGLANCLEAFADRHRSSPNVVVLPAVLSGGATYDSVYMDSAQYTPYGRLDDWRAQLQKLYPQTSLYLSIDLKMAFQQVSDCQICDQFGNSGYTLCHRNPAARAYVQAIVQEIYDKYRPEGLLLDTSEWQPTSNYPGQSVLITTCFCQHCTTAIRREARDISARLPGELQQSYTPLHFGIRPRLETGLLPLRINLKWNPQELLAHSVAHQIVHSSDPPYAALSNDERLRWAEFLLRYLTARANLTAGTIAELSNFARALGVRTAVLLEQPQYSWTDGLDFTSLAERSSADEYWLAGLPPSFAPPDGVVIHYYSMQLGRAATSAYFSAYDQFGQHAQSAARAAAVRIQRLSLRFQQALMPTRSIVPMVDFLDGYSGVCSPPVTEADVDRLTTSLLKRYEAEIVRGTTELEAVLAAMARQDGVRALPRPDERGVYKEQSVMEFAQPTPLPNARGSTAPRPG